MTIAARIGGRVSELQTGMAEIIVVDDEPGLREMLGDYLSAAGYAVRLAADGLAMDRLLRQSPARIIVLDVNMPGEDGLTIARRLRNRGERAGILMLTAQDNEQSRLNALSHGADDYIVKPFALAELLARIRAVQRRMMVPAAPPAVLTPFGRCLIDAPARRLIDPNGDATPISEQDFELLQAFLRHPRQVLSRDRLCELAHGRPLEAGERSLDIRITRLRRKIEADPAAPTTIVTLRGTGYLFDPKG